MIQINSTITQQGGDGGEVGFFVVDVVLARVVAEGFARNDNIGVGNNLMAATGLYEG